MWFFRFFVHPRHGLVLSVTHSQTVRKFLLKSFGSRPRKAVCSLRQKLWLNRTWILPPLQPNPPPSSAPCWQTVWTLASPSPGGRYLGAVLGTASAASDAPRHWTTLMAWGQNGTVDLETPEPTAVSVWLGHCEHLRGNLWLKYRITINIMTVGYLSLIYMFPSY